MFIYFSFRNFTFTSLLLSLILEIRSVIGHIVSLKTFLLWTKIVGYKEGYRLTFFLPSQLVLAANNSQAFLALSGSKYTTFVQY